MSTQTKITSAARKIAKRHNQRVASGFAGNGKLVFDSDGNGGAWYSSSSYGFGDGMIVVGMSHGKMTQREAQDILDAAAESND